MKETKESLHEIIENLNDDQITYVHRLLLNLFSNGQLSDAKV